MHIDLKPGQKEEGWGSSVDRTSLESGGNTLLSDSRVQSTMHRFFFTRRIYGSYFVCDRNNLAHSAQPQNNSIFRSGSSRYCCRVSEISITSKVSITKKIVWVAQNVLQLQRW